MSPWPTPIPVTERLPERWDEILVWRPVGWERGMYTGSGFETCDEVKLPDVTHWLPLPPPVEDPGASGPPYEATGVHSSAEVQGIADRLLARLREAPDDEARLQTLAPIFDAYCKLCGSDRGRDCQCWNDE